MNHLADCEQLDSAYVVEFENYGVTLTAIDTGVATEVVVNPSLALLAAAPITCLYLRAPRPRAFGLIANPVVLAKTISAPSPAAIGASPIASKRLKPLVVTALAASLHALIVLWL